MSGGHGAGSSTPLVQRITQGGRTQNYTYDVTGNIASIHEEGSKTLTADDLGMTHEEDPVEYAAMEN